VNTGTSWWEEARRVALVFAAASLLGWLSGYMPAALTLAALLLISLWLRQLWRVSRWLHDADKEPPEARGLWGEMFDSVYHLQRRDREERDRLQTTVAYLRDSFAALKEAAVMIDPEGRIEWSNVAAEQLLGLQYPRDRGQAVLNLLRIPSFHGYFSEGEFQEPLPMESPLDAEVRLLVEITPFGHGSRLMFARDVTREERLEEMRRDFVANVSHELRTPLTVITGYLQTLLEHYPEQDPRLRGPLQQMEEQAARMEGLLKDLLWLSQLESADEPVASSDIHIPELLSEVATQLQEAWPGRRIHTHLESGQGLQGDYRQLYSALSNLVVNALKYSDEDVDIYWREREGQLCLDVVDSGPGIDPVHLPRLTERFYRVDKSRSVETGGTGLGLAIVKHVLAGHGGHLEIESEPGVGSTFSCCFPRQ
jgi:two-component system phosphate regulon sensor histidine kinase PhoR